MASEALNFYFPGAEFKHNVLTDGKASNGGTIANYPEGNYFPGPMKDIGFQAFNMGIGGDYRLLTGSTFSGAGSDGMDIGADIEGLQLATAGVLSEINQVCDESTTNIDQDITIRKFLNSNQDQILVATLCPRDAISWQ